MLPVYIPPLPLPPALAAAAGEDGAPAPAPAATAAPGTPDARMVEAAVQFEGLFIAQMFQAMRQAADAFGEGEGGGEQAAMLDHAAGLVAFDIARLRSFGIADALLAQLADPSAAGDGT